MNCFLSDCIRYPVQRIWIVLLFLLLMQCLPGKTASAGAPKKDKDPDDKFWIRGAVGAQGGMDIFFPSDVNQLTKDFWNSLVSQYYPGDDYPGKNEAIPIIIGFHYDLKAALRVINVFQFEAWREQFWGIGLEIRTSLYSYGMGTNQTLSATYRFVPSYSALGGNLLFTPGAKRKPVFFTIGGGMGRYHGKFDYHEARSNTINGSTHSFNNSSTFTG